MSGYVPQLRQAGQPKQPQPGGGFATAMPSSVGGGVGGMNAYAPSPSPTIGGGFGGISSSINPNDPSSWKTPSPETPTPGTEGILSGPGYEEDWYKTYGKDLMGAPTSSEDLYAKGAAGSNPFYDYAQGQTIKAINDASAARGNFNSSYTMRNIGTAVADLRGQQAHELGMLAGQADQGRFGRYDRGHDYARGAQRATEGRATAAAGGVTDLAGRQAGLVSDFYGPAGKSMTDAEMASIEVMLKKAGLSAEEIKSTMDDITNAAKAVAPFVK